ncbi:hypothetical protein B0T25DRAFT_590984 [Lasiosphaeria hispida]|uniref:HNH nuclease domain-containing protein n=1 Tax=Lasiosphaeria hispida TaxID=260671 RepID=A0AAJ0HIN9_9PEZI|nr:hypothetical protein B0T25DRAFT_590984 [Lasiosphaeria hispida]
MSPSLVCKGLRALARDVFIYDLQDFDTLLGGLVLAAGVTNTNFYTMVNIIINVLPPGPFFLQNDNGTTVVRDTQPLLPGRYFIVADGTIQVVLTRTMSIQSGTQTGSFRNQVRERDGRCVAVHIFPLAYEHQWLHGGWSQRITIPAQRGGSINSVQNGLLLRNDIHQLFDLYHFSINPDPDNEGIAGTSLDDPQRPLDVLLQWHFRQDVLTNMRGAGEPHFEHDFPPGSDIMGDIRDGPNAAERMEFELFGRLAHHMDINSEEKQDEEDEQGGNVSDKG